MSSIIPSSTAVLLRQCQTNFEVLILKRSSQLKEAANYWVFPGGKVEAKDFREDDACAIKPTQTNPTAYVSQASVNQATARQTVIRETCEETQLSIEELELEYFAHWTTPDVVKKRYATWFFIAQINNQDSQKIKVDGSEISESAWLSAEQILREYQQHKIKLMPPTLVTLIELSRFSKVQDALGFYRQRGDFVIEPIMTELQSSAAEHSAAKASKQLCMLYNGDAGYQTVDAQLLDVQHRLILNSQGIWQYINTI